MTPHLLAVETYGSHRIRRAETNKTVSAQKIGYSTCGRDVLLALYGAQAVDVTSKQASYHYVQITGETALHNGTLLFALTDEELATVERITRAHPGQRSGCWRWFDRPGHTDNGWHSFPTQHQPDYQPNAHGSGPRYNPTGYRAISPSSPASTQPAIRAERTQRSATDTPWWWISGDTYPHRAALKAAGGRWSRKRKAWYFIGEHLPAAVQQLIDGAAMEAQPTETAPEQLTGTYAGGRFRVGDPVQAAHDFLALGGGTIPGGTRGTVTKCYEAAGELGHSYDVRFDGSGMTWCFEGDLASVPEPPPPAAAALPVPDKPPTEADALPVPPEVPAAEAEPSKGVPGVDVPRFAIGQTVYTNARIKLDEDGTLIPQGTSGQIVRRFDLRETDKYERFGYRVQFNAAWGGQHQHALFERTLQAEALSQASLRVIRDEPVMLVPGADGQSLTAAHIARREAILTGTDWDAPAESEPPATEPEPPAPEPESPADETEPQNDESTPIRVQKPEPLPAHLQTAVEAARGKAVTVAAPRFNGARTPIPQAFVGELTGSISGNVYCYGFATHQGVLLYLNFGGPRTAVEAIRAKLAKGEAVNLTPWDAPAIELSAGETDGAANTGMFTAYLHSISEAKFTSVILVHQWLIEPNYGGKAVTAIFRTSEEQSIAKLTDHVRKLVKVPVFDAWGGFLLSAGESAGLVRSPRSGGGIDLRVIALDAEAWSRLITGGLANGVIALPERD